MSSPPRKRGSSETDALSAWIPAYAGMTVHFWLGGSHAPQRKHQGETMTVAASAAPTDRTQALIGIARIVMGLSFIYYGVSKFFFIPGTIAFIGTKLPFPSLIFWLA